MNKNRLGIAGLAALLSCLIVGSAICAGGAAAADPVTKQVHDALDLAAETKGEQALALLNPLLDRKDLTDQDRIGMYAALGAICYSIGEKQYDRAFAYLEKIRELDPCLVHLPAGYWCDPLRTEWYRTLQANQQLTCPSTSPDLRTIAIMEFDNYSAGKYQEELGFIAKGLSDAFEADFRDLDGLDVVERDKIEFVLKEIMMSKEGLVDESTAVRAGKLLGAQIMVFGSIMQLDGKSARMLVKAVKVETSEILATAERTGKPDFFTMQKELTKELARKLDIVINPQTEQIIDANGSDNNAAGVLYAKGLDSLDRYDYTKAYEYFKKAYELDNTYSEAKDKMDIYRPLAMSS
jgi:tetratricopeptide (TPR) repeat protein